MCQVCLFAVVKGSNVVLLFVCIFLAPTHSHGMRFWENRSTNEFTLCSNQYLSENDDDNDKCWWFFLQYIYKTSRGQMYIQIFLYSNSQVRFGPEEM